MADEMKLYRASDNTELSPSGQFGNAVEFTLRADLEESDSERLYAMADNGYEVTGVTVEPQGTTAAKWEMGADDGGSEGAYEAPGDPLTLGTVGAGSGGRVYFWVRASATDDEEISNDTSVVLRAAGVGAAV